MLFPGAIGKWTEPQKRMAFWLRYFDNFYEAVNTQMSVIEKEVAKPWMANYDVVVDAFLVWYDWKAKEKNKERGDYSSSHEANVPRASDHKQVFRGAH